MENLKRIKFLGLTNTKFENDIFEIINYDFKTKVGLYLKRKKDIEYIMDILKDKSFDKLYKDYHDEIRHFFEYIQYVLPNVTIYLFYDLDNIISLIIDGNDRIIFEIRLNINDINLDFLSIDDLEFEKLLLETI
jgi:hypothetical protein